MLQANKAGHLLQGKSSAWYLGVLWKWARSLPAWLTRGSSWRELFWILLFTLEYSCGRFSLGFCDSKDRGVIFCKFDNAVAQLSLMEKIFNFLAGVFVNRAETRRTSVSKLCSTRDTLTINIFIVLICKIYINKLTSKFPSSTSFTCYYKKTRFIFLIKKKCSFQKASAVPSHPVAAAEAAPVPQRHQVTSEKGRIANQRAAAFYRKSHHRSSRWSRDERRRWRLRQPWPHRRRPLRPRQPPRTPPRTPRRPNARRKRPARPLPDDRFSSSRSSSRSRNTWARPSARTWPNCWTSPRRRYHGS